MLDNQKDRCGCGAFVANVALLERFWLPTFIVELRIASFVESGCYYNNISRYLAL